MPNWKKLIVSGSDANLNSLDVLASITGSTFLVNDTISIADGTAAAPSLRFTDDPDTGIYRSTDNTFNVTVGGTNMLAVNSSGITSGANVYSGTNGQFRNYSGVWHATAGTTGNGFKFSSADLSDLLTISSTGDSVFKGDITITDTTGTRGISRNNTGYNLNLMGGTDLTDGAYISLSGEGRGGASNSYNGRVEIYSGGGGLANQAAALGDIIFGTKWNGGSSNILVLDSSTNNATFAGDIDADDITINDWNSVSASLSTLTQNQTLNSGGTVNYVARFESADTITTGIIRDDGSTVGINAAPSANKTLYIDGTIQATGEAFFSHLDIIGTGGNSRIRDDVQFKFGTNRIFGIQYNSTADQLQFVSSSNTIVAIDGDGNITGSASIHASGSGSEIITDQIFRAAQGTIRFRKGTNTWDAMMMSSNGKLELANGGANDRGEIYLHADHGSTPRAGVVTFENEYQGTSYLFTDTNKRLKFHTSDPGEDDSVGEKVFYNNFPDTATFAGDVIVDGTITAQEFHTEFVSASIIYESGSTKFGDTSDDTHSFTGSLTVTDGTINLGKIWNPGSGGSIGVYNGSGQQSIQLYGNILRNNQSSLLLNYGVTQDIHAYSGTTSYFTLDASAQSVGIGTTSPNSKLDVRRSSSGIVAEFQSTAGTSDEYVDVKLISGNTNSGTYGTILRHQRVGTSGADFAILTNPTLTGTPVERFRVQKDGALKFNSYGSGNNTGTLAYTIGVDSSGNVIEFTGGSGGSVSSITGGADTRVAYFNGSDSLEGSANFTWDDTQLTIVGDVEADEFIGDLRGAVLFKAQAGEALSKGDVVYISGISGNTTVVSKADADDANKMPAFGVAATAASLNNPIDIYTFGSLRGIDTSTPGWSLGDELYVSTTAGGLTNSAPTGESALLQKIGKVTRVHNSSGSIKIMGAGRTNAVPNLNEGRLFVGNASNQAVADGTIHVDIANSRVGIGTTLPSAKLEVYDGDIKLNDGTRNLLIGEEGGSSYQIKSSGYLIIDATSSIQINKTTSGNVTVASGNVGIGTTSPSRKLTVGNTNAATGNAIALASTGSVGGYSQLAFGDETDDNKGQIIYQPSSGKLQLQTGGGGVVSNRGLTLDSSENVGIGTASPATKLQVVGNVSVTAGKAYRIYNTAGNGWGEMTFNQTDNRIQFNRGIQNSGADFLLHENGDSYINANEGNVGIGTSTPGAKLDVHGRVDFANDLRLRGTDSAADQGVVRFYVNSNNELTIDSANNGNNLFVIDEGGQVGINTSSPSRTLDVNGEIQNNGIFRRAGNVIIKSTGSETMFGPGGSGIITFHSSSTMTTGDETMRIDANGNLLLNNTSAGARLDIREDTNYAIRAEDASGHYFRVNTGGDVDMRGDLTVQGIITAQEFHTEFVSASIIYESGSTKFGDTSDDNHDFTGSLNLNGDAYFSGNVGIGTTTPADKLHVDGARSNFNGIKIGENNNKIQFGNVDGKISVGNNNWLIFSEGATEFMRAGGSAGNVGIGTTSPSTKLHVSGSGEVIRLQGVTGQSYMTFFQGTGGRVGYIGTSGTTGMILESADQLNLYSGGTTTMYLDSNNEVGIGTTSPNDKLHIYSGSLRLEDGATSVTQLIPGGGGNSTLTFKGGNYIHNVYFDTSWNNFRYARLSSSYNTSDSNFYLYKSDSSGGTAATTTISTGTSTFAAGVTVTGDIDADDITIDDWGSVSASLASISDAGGVNGTGAANKLAIWSDSDTLTSDTNLHWDSTNDRLGIGTATPAQKLHIQGSALLISGSGTAAIRAYPTSNTYEAQLKFTSNEMQYVWGGGVKAYFDPSNRLSFGDKDPGNAGAGAAIRDPKIGKFGSDVTGSFGIKTADIFRVYVSGSGEVGIGTTTPDESLHVNGNIKGSTLYALDDVVVADKILHYGDTDTYIGFEDNTQRFFAAGEEMIKFNSSIVTINEASGNNDLRVKGNTDNNLFYTDGSTDRVGIGTSTPSAKLDIEGDVQIKSANISYQENTDVDSAAAETIATVAHASYDATFFDYVVKNGTNLRAGTVMAVHDGTNVEFTDNSTKDIGTTSGVTFSVDISGNDLRLRATTTTDNWTIKTLVRSI